MENDPNKRIEVELKNTKIQTLRVGDIIIINTGYKPSPRQ
jgi:ASC-1-like (ASCH) protein